MPVPLPLSILAFTFGAVLGSFGNVLILRLPAGKTLGGRSRCPHCGATVKAWQLIPILNFFLLRGKCGVCRHPISWQYPLVELASGLLFVFVLHREFTVPALTILTALSLWLLLLIAVSDGRTGLIPDALSIPFILCAFLRAIVWVSAGVWSWPALLMLVFPGALIAGGFFAFQWIISRGRWVGSGDILLATGIGFLLTDPAQVILALGLAYVLGAAVAVVLLARGIKERGGRLAFGPFLALGAFIVFVWGDIVLRIFFPI